MATTSTTFDPATTATSLATAYTQATQDLLTTQTTAAKAKATALTKLQSALTSFSTALQTLSGKKGMSLHSASVSDTTIGTASATPAATAGSYALFVEQTATASQIAVEDLPAVPVSLGGPLVVKTADGSAINVNLEEADTNQDGTISQAEIARAINQSSDNQGKVTAMVMTVGSTSQLVLSASSTGAGSQISLDTSGLPAGALKDALGTTKELSAARDAVFWLGAQGTGTRVQQASNSFTAIPGVTFTASKAMTSGSPSLLLTVGNDSSSTTSNVQAFVDAYNTLESALDDLTSTGDAANGVAAAAFASDSGVRALRDHLASLVRQTVGGTRAIDYGLAFDRTGKLTLDSTKFAKAQASNPDGLNTLFGSTTAGSSSGLLGTISSYVDQWTNSTSGQIKSRQDSVSKLQQQLTSKQTTLDDRYNQAYSRYLKQFTALQTLQQQMSQNSSIFDSLTSN
jgi:flagellar hook-associated protein 2